MIEWSYGFFIFVSEFSLLDHLVDCFYIAGKYMSKLQIKARDQCNKYCIAFVQC